MMMMKIGRWSKNGKDDDDAPFFWPTVRVVPRKMISNYSQTMDARLEDKRGMTFPKFLSCCSLLRQPSERSITGAPRLDVDQIHIVFMKNDDDALS
jgi:hypothetical protein